MCDICEIVSDAFARSEVFPDKPADLPNNIKPDHETEPDPEKPCEDGCPSVERVVQIQRDKEQEEKK